eukprot:CAMPEP_0119519460 /NCGR_PEP_ID=MMETSP1344-20130328/35761_1 /TAXON_ID=236787 /ORGANISM="Florenciella parvula, Strain CCMP2471" /LENGTH=31 /DNA_ID= /DNA_START= /DNA_END= /DNA_ORIENTATION=
MSFLHAGRHAMVQTGRRAMPSAHAAGMSMST